MNQRDFSAKELIEMNDTSGMVPEEFESNVEKEFGNTIDSCTCEKEVIGQGWFDGKWRDGKEVDPSNHEDDCPKFEDNSHAESLEEELS